MAPGAVSSDGALRVRAVRPRASSSSGSRGGLGGASAAPLIALRIAQHTARGRATTSAAAPSPSAARLLLQAQPPSSSWLTQLAVTPKRSFGAASALGTSTARSTFFANEPCGTKSNESREVACNSVACNHRPYQASGEFTDISSELHTPPRIRCNYCADHSCNYTDSHRIEFSRNLPHATFAPSAGIL